MNMIFRFLIFITAFLFHNCQGQNNMLQNVSHSKIAITVVYDNVSYDFTLTSE